MSDELVTRLRQLSAFQKTHRFGDLLDDWSGQAADEIERLRADRDRWANVAKQMFESHSHYVGEEDWCPSYMSEKSECTCGYAYLKQQYEKAVRGE